MNVYHELIKYILMNWVQIFMKTLFLNTFYISEFT
jgi:hypothetical protein